MAPTFRPCEPDQMLLLAPDVREWLPEGHFAHHVSDLVDGLDLTAFYAPYEGDGRRNAPYEPRMMVKVLLYGYATGVFSSRAMARKLEESALPDPGLPGSILSVNSSALSSRRLNEWSLRDSRGGSAVRRGWQDCWVPGDQSASTTPAPAPARRERSLPATRRCSVWAHRRRHAASSTSAPSPSSPRSPISPPHVPAP